MEVKVLNEQGYQEAMLGLSLSYNQPVEKMPKVAEVQSKKEGGGHDKFLESIVIWVDVIAPRNWWSHLDTYRVGISKQSESTMHTILRKPLTQADFEYNIPWWYLIYLNLLIKFKKFDRIKNDLPEGFLQRRVVCLNYKTLKNIYNQRKDHRLPAWQKFLNQVTWQIQHPEFIL